MKQWLGKLKWLNICIAMVMLQGCATHRDTGIHEVRRSADDCVRLAAQLDYCLRLPQQAAAFSLSLTQRIQIEWKVEGEVRQFDFLTVLETDQRHTTLVLLSPIGQTLLTLQQDGQGVKEQVVMPLPRGFDPQLLLALVQLALWPQAALQPGLHDRCAQLSFSATRRLLECDRVTVVQVDYPDAQQPYTYQLQWMVPKVAQMFHLRAIAVTD